MVGLEPTTPGLEVQCAIQLRYMGLWKKVLPRIELGSRDSKSHVLTITP